MSLSRHAKTTLPFVIVNPAHIRRFAGVLGQLAKTDKIDAQLIAHFGEAMKPTLSELRPELMQRTLSGLRNEKSKLFLSLFISLLVALGLGF